MDNTNNQTDTDYKRSVFVDMDGVLADFNGGFQELTGMTNNQVTDEELWNRIIAHGKAKFFAELNWMSGGKDLWKYVTENFLQTKILSALGKSDITDKQTTQGKMMWLRKNIPSLPSNDIIFVSNKHQKKKYCKPGDIIIDDTPSTIEEWMKKGGVGILHKTASDTITKLKQYV